MLGARSRISPVRRSGSRSAKKWGGLTPLLFAAREGDLETVKALLDAGADVNERSEYGWTALLVATHNRFYQLGRVSAGAWRGPEPRERGRLDAAVHRDGQPKHRRRRLSDAQAGHGSPGVIRKLLAANANPNLRMRSSTETRTVFTHQWLLEEGATPFLRAAQSGDIVLMKLLLEHGADPSIPTDHGVTPLMVASGIGWVEGVTYEWSPQANLEAVKLLLELGADVNAQDSWMGEQR